MLSVQCLLSVPMVEVINEHPFESGQRLFSSALMGLRGKEIMTTRRYGTDEKR